MKNYRIPGDFKQKNLIYLIFFFSIGEQSGQQQQQNCQIASTGIMLKLNKALLISKKQNFFIQEEYYKYAIELKVNNEYWVIFRRYSEIRDEHERMCKKNSALKREQFPPRTPFNKTDSFQIERQQKLEIYLKNYIQTCLGDNIYQYSDTLKSSNTNSNVVLKMDKQTFCDLFNFFNETVEDKLNVQKLNWKSSDLN